MSSTPPAMDLDPARRAAFSQELRDALVAQCPGSVAELRGSLARGTADSYSDIDLAWTVPDAQFETCVAAVGPCLGAVRAVVSLRSDPDSQRYSQRPCRRRLLFLAFRDMPLFWRLDLEIAAVSDESAGPGGVVGAGAGGDRAQDGGSPAAVWDPEWSLAASALANAVAVVKAVLRGQPDVAAGLLERGLRRVGASGSASGRWRADVVRLADAAAQHEPAQRPLADQVKRLAAELLEE
ncbi:MULTISPECIES: nucleotidyltransferase domain-containing protein [unclassified Streptomyces]|uniref:nucleotidyltransferase domain-containing protein n=1 Tax=unclassified Streptomyces TaxID=2593676 RepID=UPI002E213D51|nr:nucleotidyltransferase domain-containing protein [Streptomyces sp. NBC_01023]